MRERENGTYEGRISLGYDSHGKRRQVSAYGKTEREVQDKLDEIKQQFKDGLTPTNATTAASFLDRWLITLGGKKAPSTIASYKSIVEKYLKPWLRNRSLSQIRPDDLETYYLELATREIGRRTISKVHATLRTALAYALRSGRVSRNVATMIEPPAYEPLPKRVLNTEQVKALFATLNDGPGATLFGLAFLTQMREGELLALRWSDIDLDAKVLTVHRTLQDGEDGRPVVGTKTKTRAGTRSILLPKKAVAMLRLHRPKDAAESDLVFPSANGTPLRRQNVLRRWLRPALVAAGLPPISFHEIRHTGATIMGDEHPRALQQRLGHSHASTTMDIYLTLPVAAQKPLAAKLDEIFEGTVVGKGAHRKKKKPVKR